jgi:hypothetical protein
MAKTPCLNKTLRAFLPLKKANMQPPAQERISIVTQQFGGAVVLLSSGQTLRMRSVMLFEQESVNEISALRAGAVQKLGGGSSSGIGFLGSPEWVLGAWAVTSLISGALAATERKDALEMLNTAATKSLELANGGSYFPLDQVRNYHLPYPALWSAEVVSNEIVQAWRLSKQALTDLLKENNLTKADVAGRDQMTLAVKRQYVHSGEDFLNVETDIGPMNVRWDSVIGYACPPP